MADVNDGGRVSKMPLVAMGAVVVLAIAVTIALISFPRRANPEPGTPEAVVQEFIQAGLDDDSDAALALLTTNRRRFCEQDFVEERYGSRFYGDELRASIDSTELTDDSAVIEIEFRGSNADDPFDSSTWSFDARYELVRVADDWRIDRAGWPDAFERCTRGSS